MLKPEEYFEPLPASEKNEEYIAMKSKSFAKDVWERFCSNKRARGLNSAGDNRCHSSAWTMDFRPYLMKEWY